MRILTIMLLLASATLPAAAATTSIVVTGTGTVSAAPDMATVSFTINTYAATAESALSANNVRFNRFESAMRGLGVANADVQTTGFNLNYNAPPTPPEAPSPGQRYGYNASRSIDVVVHRLTLAGKVIDEATGAGVTDVGGVSFAVSDTSGQNSAALKVAVSRARSQAEALAEAAGLRIVGIRDIRQGGGVFQPTPAADIGMVMAGRRVPTVIQPNAVQTSATVTVDFIAQ